MTDVPAASSLYGLWRPKVQLAPILIRKMRRLLSKVTYGDITVVLPNGKTLHRLAANPGPSAKLVIHRWLTVWRLITGGEPAFADAFIAGEWWTPDLIALLDFGARNESSIQHAISGTNFQRVLDRLWHWRNRNTRRGSRRNIAAHYDLGNAFYSLWLDRGMNYSSALFSTSDQPIEAAQEAKLDQVIRLLDLSGGERVLEIGCGWGALMERLAEYSNVTGITLSTEQLAYTQERLAKKPTHYRTEVRLEDYRDVQETYDRIVSIEMIEAVGESYWPIYFAKLRHALTKNGTVLLQAITIAEERSEKYRNQPDYIQRYIFPGGALPTVGIILQEAAKADLELVAHQSFGQSYARTLAIWRERFLASWTAIEKLGFDASFKRMWDYYLCYCEAGFRNGAIDVGFYTFKPYSERFSIPRRSGNIGGRLITAHEQR